MSAKMWLCKWLVCPIVGHRVYGPSFGSWCMRCGRIKR